MFSLERGISRFMSFSLVSYFFLLFFFILLSFQGHRRFCNNNDTSLCDVFQTCRYVELGITLAGEFMIIRIFLEMFRKMLYDCVHSRARKSKLNETR